MTYFLKMHVRIYTLNLGLETSMLISRSAVVITDATLGLNQNESGM